MATLHDILFPYPKIREVQVELLQDVASAVEEKHHLVVHAPTGLGKTAATLGPALSYARKHKKTVFFLTSRHTQHAIALKTLREIKHRHKITFHACSIIGKKWMCAQPGTHTLSSKDFADYCKALREEQKCSFYANTKNSSGKPSVKANHLVSELGAVSPRSTEYVVEKCTHAMLCPYYASLLLAEKAEVIITDYYYLLNPSIRALFLNNINKKIEDAIIIIDEGHNLPARARELMTQRLSSFVLQQAIKEAKKYRLEDVLIDLVEIQDI